MKSLRTSYDKKRSTVDETDAAAAEAQSGENESDPDLDFVSACFSSGEHILVSVRRVLREGSKTGLSCCFDCVERVEKVHSASNDCTYM